jgi:hypothetical protein
VSKKGVYPVPEVPIIQAMTLPFHDCPFPGAHSPLPTRSPQHISSRRHRDGVAGKPNPLLSRHKKPRGAGELAVRTGHWGIGPREDLGELKRGTRAGARKGGVCKTAG